MPSLSHSFLLFRNSVVYFFLLPFSLLNATQREKSSSTETTQKEERLSAFGSCMDGETELLKALL
jgi:hypothetical protein